MHLNGFYPSPDPHGRNGPKYKDMLMQPNSEKNNRSRSRINVDDSAKKAILRKPSIPRNPNNNFMNKFAHTKSITVRSSYQFKPYFQLKKDELENQTISILIEDRLFSNASRGDLLFIISSSDKSKLDKAFDEISSWKVVWKNIPLEENEFAKLKLEENEIISKAKRYYTHTIVVFNEQKKQIEITLPDKSKSGKIFSYVESICLSQVDSKRVIAIESDEEFELLRSVMDNKEFRQKNNLNSSIKIEYSRGKVIFKGPKDQMKRVNFQKCQQINRSTKHTMNLDRNSYCFIENRLNKKFKPELLQSFVLLKYSFTSNAIITFELLGFIDQEQLQTIQQDLIKNFLKKAIVKTIDLKSSDNFDNILKKVKEFQRNIRANDDASEQGSTNGDHEATFDFNVNIEIVPNLQLKKIFINGTDSRELEEVKRDLQEKLNGSQVCNGSKKLPELVYKNLNLDTLKQYGKTVQVRLNFNPAQHLIRLNGPTESVEMVSAHIENRCSQISNDFVTTSFKINKSELAYLEDCQKDLRVIASKSNSFIRLFQFERFGLVAIGNAQANIELIHGDITKLYVNAYINPANCDLAHIGGLAQVLSHAGGGVIKMVIFYRIEVIKATHRKIKR